MGELTLAEYRTEVEAALPRTGVGNTLLDRWVNQSAWEFAYKFKFRELENLAEFNLEVGKYSYQIDSVLPGFRAFHEEGAWIVSPKERVRKLISDTRQNWLRKVDIHETSARTKPTHYHKYSDCLFVRPVPDGTLTRVQFHFWKTLKLVNPTDKLPFASDWDDVALVGAIARGLRHFNDLDRYLNMRADFIGMVRSRATQEDFEEFPEGGIEGPPTDLEDLSGARSLFL